MQLTHDELLHHLQAMDDALSDAVAHAHGLDPDGTAAQACLRQLDGPARSLRAMLEGDATTVLGDAVDAARAVLVDPDAGMAGLGHLETARNTLHAVVHRQAERLRLQEAELAA
ncbi:hypothetical protein GCM10028862_21240 [Luteimonas pelagia]